MNAKVTKIITYQSGFFISFFISSREMVKKKRTFFNSEEQFPETEKPDYPLVLFSLAAESSKI